jgi:hypothetical protein
MYNIIAKLIALTRYGCFLFTPRFAIQPSDAINYSNIIFDPYKDFTLYIIIFIFLYEELLKYFIAYILNL